MRGRLITTLFLLLFTSFCACRDVATYSDNSPVEYTTWENHSHFFVGSGALHENIDCNKCHGPFTTFKQFTCLTSDCHLQPATDAIHTAVPDYSFTSTKCYGCHFIGQGDGITRDDHTLTKFPISATDTHGSIACKTCHENYKDIKDVSCTTCHTHKQTTSDGQHTGISASSRGYKFVSSACLNCHSNSQVLSISTHANYFAIQSGTHGAPSIGCLDCHNKKRTDRTYTAADFTFFSCYGACHQHSASETNSHHSGVGGYDPAIFTNQAFMPCVTCHPNGSGGGD